MTPPATRTTRRRFLGSAAVLAAPYLGWKTTARGAAPSATLRYACFGAAGRAWRNITGMDEVSGVKLVAVAEADKNRLKQVAEGFPDAKVYGDWRRLLEELGDEIDAVVVSTPDHLHAPMTMGAMQLGKHVYCEKPLTRTLSECRALHAMAESSGLVTQMGNQLASGSGNRLAAEILRQGLVGKVVAVHSMNPKSWGSMEPLPQREDPVPEGLDWEAWIGPARMRPYLAGEFHPSNWRKRIGYGTGNLGDMGCHIYHPWFAGLGAPEVVSAVSHGPGPVDAYSWPTDALVRYRMKGNELTEGEFAFTWYDGEQLPDEEVCAHAGGREQVPASGSLVIGTEGALTIPHGSGEPVLYRNGAPTEIAIEAPDSEHHHGDFVAAIRGESSEPPRCHFGYAAPMTEAVLVGTVATLLPGEELRWDAEAGRFANSEKANELASHTYREGWEVEGL